LENRRASIALGWLWLAAAGCVAHRPTPPAPTPPAPAAPLPPPLHGRQPHAEPELVIRHRVEKGQNLYRIALSYGLTADQLAKANGIGDPTQLAVGQELVIPKVDGPATVEAPPPPSTSLPAASPAASSPPGRPAARPAAVSASAPAARPARPPVPGQGSGDLSWPLKGVLYARFGKKGSEPHDGIDLAAPLGTPVRAAAEGKVAYAAEQKGYGLLAILEHGNGLITLYAHNHELKVKSGQKVRRGQVIATVGESGRTSGPHLHFEVRQAGVPQDPLKHLGPLD
jgi:murein DD-endopeptidase MepM/ murein hydrolase activator NlpD